MTNNYINFKRQRELGEIINDTFKFIRENYKPLFRLIFRIVGPVFIVLVFALGYYHYVGGGNPFVDLEGFKEVSKILVALGILMFAALAFFVLLQGTVLYFIKSYIEHDGKVVDQEVYSGVRNNLGKLTGTTILAFLLTMIGAMFCFLPGIYLWVPMSLTIPLVIFAGKGVTDAIADSFDLIRNNWWITFASLFVLSLLVYIIGLVFQIPMMIYIFFKAMTMSQEASAADPKSLFDWVYTIISVLASMVQYLLYTIITIALAFIYYNLEEKRNFTGTYETISNLGSSEN